jgi:cytochrome c
MSGVLSLPGSARARKIFCERAFGRGFYTLPWIKGSNRYAPDTGFRRTGLFMLDTMTFTKILGGLCGALLIFLLGKWGAESIYHAGGHGHGDDHAMAYAIEVDGGAEEEEVVEVSFEEVFASADAGAGERVWGKCRACHKLEQGANGVGPYLYGVVDRDIGAVDGFNYSGNLQAAAEVWTPENLNAFLENPRGWAPGTTMSFNGLPKIEDRANLIAYLATIGG